MVAHVFNVGSIAQLKVLIHAIWQTVSLLFSKVWNMINLLYLKIY